MKSVLRLTVLTGPHKGEKFCICTPAAGCVIGRAPDCPVQMTGTLRDRSISRWHCELAVQPDHVEFRDLGSRNGTYLNGVRFESLELALAAISADPPTGPTFQQGDLLTVGGTTFRLDLVQCPPPNEQADWPEGQLTLKNCPVSCI